MRFVFFIGAVDLTLSAIGYIYYRCNLPFARTLPFGLVYLFLAINTVASVMLPASAPALLVKLSAWLEGLWIAFIFYSLLAALVHFLAWLPLRLAGIQLPNAKIACALLVASCCFIAWGTWRAFHPNLRTEVIETEKLESDASYRIVLLSDVHLGRILGRSYAQSLAERVNDLKPDLIVIAGDLIDERIQYVTQEGSLSAVAQMKAPLGTYLVFGNHEYFDDPDRWQQMAEAAGIKVLRDKDAIIDGKIKLTGLNDYLRYRSDDVIFALSGKNERFYSILVDHQPRKMLVAEEAGYDLYLSGHTHTGQLFPNRQVTKRMYLLDYGRREFGKLTAITSNGYGFWGPPVRTEVAPELVLIELKGK